jgi:hypothetical protein
MNAREHTDWAHAVVEFAGSPLPVYGSPEWVALDEGDFRKFAAAVVAAEAWTVDFELLRAEWLSTDAAKEEAA